MVVGESDGASADGRILLHGNGWVVDAQLKVRAEAVASGERVDVAVEFASGDELRGEGGRTQVRGKREVERVIVPGGRCRNGRSICGIADIAQAGLIGEFDA